MSEEQTIQEESPAQAIEAIEATEVEDAVEASPEEAEVHKKNGFEKRVSKLNQKITAAQQESDFWKAEALKNKQSPQASPQPPPQSDKPTLTQFNGDFASFTEALSDWKVEQYAKKQEQAKLVDSYKSRETSFAKDNSDYYESLEDASDIPVHNDIRQVIWESDVGPAIAYHLSHNPEEIDRLNKLTPHKRLLELGKLESAVSAKTTVKTPKLSSAPKPISPVSGKAPSIGKSIYQMNKDELRAHLRDENKASIKRKLGR